MNSLSIFTVLGEVEKSLDPTAVALLDEHDQSVLQDTLENCLAAEQQDTLVIELRDKVRDLMVVHDAAVTEDQLRNKPADATEAARAWIASQNDLPHPKRPLHKKSRLALIEAGETLAAARADHQRALVRQKELNGLRAAAIGRWMQTQKQIDPLSLARESAAKFVPNPVETVVHRYPIESAGREAKSRQRTPANQRAFPGGGLPIIKDIYRR